MPRKYINVTQNSEVTLLTTTRTFVLTNVMPKVCAQHIALQSS